ncbi:MAG: aminodeoxychorismate synthase component I [Alphaproteobacteria bacterium]|nr:MAG: aminodeoxychorismate synthase component I [Alphaproteobacteria bacterium]
MSASRFTLSAEPPPAPVARTSPEAGFVLLDDALTPGGRGRIFEDPVAIVRCDDPDGIEAALEEITRALARGLHAAGFLSYELGYLMEPRLSPRLPEGRTQPLLWMGLYARCRPLGGAALDDLFNDEPSPSIPTLRHQRLSWDRDAYLGAVRRVRDYIAAGDVYQINLTLRVLFEITGDPWVLYGALRRAQPVAHGAFIRTGEFDILSLSPELFLSARDGTVLARPMKGTAARRAHPEEDAAQRDWLHHDPKSRAENLMIVDLLRNDLGRVAEIGSVAVPDLFTVETYPTVHQMTSSITARLSPGVGPGELLRSLFPCGSITGAPKIRAMEIIRELEPAPRGVYTGAIGMFAPDGTVNLNVAIRTLVIDRDGHGQMGIGSGIVFDSDPEAEFDECLLKARFLNQAAPAQEFHLLETLRWEAASGYHLLGRHLDRLARSATYFGFSCDLAAIRRTLIERTRGFAASTMRVRLLLARDGTVTIEAAPLLLPGADAVLRYALAPCPLDRDDPFLHHKTTQRTAYEAARTRLHAATGCDEVIFINDRGEITEGSYTNVFVRRAGRTLTPPLRCGLLDGTLRRALLDDPTSGVEETVLTPADLGTAEAVYLGNSVRGLVRARPVHPPAEESAKINRDP